MIHKNISSSSNRNGSTNNTQHSGQTFQTEKSRMGQYSRKKDKAEFLQKSMTVRKRSMLPKGNLYISLHIFNGICLYNTQLFLCSQSLIKTMMMKKQTTKKMKIMKINEEKKKESTPSQVFQKYTFCGVSFLRKSSLFLSP